MKNKIEGFLMKPGEWFIQSRFYTNEKLYRKTPLCYSCRKKLQNHFDKKNIEGFSYAFWSGIVCVILIAILIIGGKL